MIYATNRCNSRCNHCNIWKQTPKTDISLNVVEDIISAKCTNSNFYETSFGLEGGEFILHPKYREILELVKDRDHILLSNAILDDRLINAVREFKVKNVHISLDGNRDGYIKVRGIDNFDKINHVVQELKNETRIKMVYSATPFNKPSDFEFVKKYCKKNNVEMGISIFANYRLFEIDKGFKKNENVIKNYNLRNINNDYVKTYKKWIAGKTKLPCISPLFKIVCYPNGDIPFCCGRKEILGNLYQKSLDEIWYSKKTKKIQKSIINKCNQCWISYHRPSDFFYINLFKKCMPEPIVKKVLGVKYEF
ncbi:MAG: hypothetical protein A2Y66_02130 [Nitrospirae bacterium RBG_13_41_22]|nr:MAG: hypothetical protein A2Y66_02130 [Nitrospirae bacterium RBG_13_41_22]